jgi:hypothetical protein
MFTDFLAECRAAKLGLDTPIQDPMGSAKVLPELKQKSRAASSV